MFVTICKIIYFYKSGSFGSRIRTRFQAHEVKYVFAELNKGLLRLNHLIDNPLTLVICNNTIRLVSSVLPTDAVITVETSSALDEVSKSFFNSVFHPTKNIPPRLLGETGVRKH